MKRLLTYITEDKNTHMEHLEDNLLNAGVNGARESINYLRALRDMLSGDSKAAVNVTVKWDGAPAVLQVQIHLTVSSLWLRKAFSTRILKYIRLTKI